MCCSRTQATVPKPHIEHGIHLDLAITLCCTNMCYIWAYKYLGPYKTKAA